MKTEVLSSMTAAEYHSATVTDTPALSASIAKVLLNKSPFHAWIAHPALNPKHESEHKDVFDLGTTAHAMLLEGDDSGIVVVDATDWRTKAAKEERDEARAAVKIALLPHQMEQVREMVDAAIAFMNASEFADIFPMHGVAEKAIFWKEGETQCKMKFDWLSNDRRIIIDYKSTNNSEPNAFIRAMPRLGYDVQAEFYPRGVEAATGTRPEFFFLAQDTEYPYACSLIGMSNAYKEVAGEKVERAIETWADCMASNKWPGYPARVCYAEPSAWQVNELLAGEEE